MVHSRDEVSRKADAFSGYKLRVRKGNNSFRQIHQHKNLLLSNLLRHHDTDESHSWLLQLRGLLKVYFCHSY